MGIDDQVESKIELTSEQIALASDRTLDEVLAEKEPKATNEPIEEASSEQSEQPSTEGQVGAGDGEIDDIQADPPSTWIDDEVLTEAAAYGLDKDDLTEIGGLDEFRRAEKLMNLQTRQLAEQQNAQQQQPVKQQEEEAEEEQPAPYEKIDLKDIDFDEYDETSGKIFKAVQQQQEFIDQMTAAAAESEKAAHLNAFHDLVDTMDPEFYGKSVNDAGELTLTKKDHERRAKLYDEMALVTESIERQMRQGRNVPKPSQKAIYKRADLMAHGDDRAKQKRSKRTEAARKQSQKRRPVASSAGASYGKTDMGDDVDEVVAIANSPEVRDFWRKAQDENGV